MQGPTLGFEVLADMYVSVPPLGCEQLGELKQPTLLLTGERSPAIFLLMAAELERCVEGKSHVTVPQAGHGMHEENAAFYNQAVMAFLRRR